MDSPTVEVEDLPTVDDDDSDSDLSVDVDSACVDEDEDEDEDPLDEVVWYSVDCEDELDHWSCVDSDDADDVDWSAVDELAVDSDVVLCDEEDDSPSLDVDISA